MTFKLIQQLCLIFFISLFLGCKSEKRYSSKNPNIIIIYTDDLGYGDVSAYNKGTLNTPNIDKLANEGIRFNNGYASSATCSPSRYALLTGTYPWRKSGLRVITGGSLAIDTTEMTIPKVLRTQGYHTGIVGKWHLGLGSGDGVAGSGIIDYNSYISPGPNQVGFDYSYIMPDTQDRVPTVYIENGNVVNLDLDDPIEVNFFHQNKHDDYGLPTDLPWGMEFPNGIPPSTYQIFQSRYPWVDLSGFSPGVLKVHPTQIYETLIGSGIFYYLYQKRQSVKVIGSLFFTYLTLAGTERFMIEFLRINQKYFLGFSGAQLISLTMISIGLWFLYHPVGETKGYATEEK